MCVDGFPRRNGQHNTQTLLNCHQYGYTIACPQSRGFLLIVEVYVKEVSSIWELDQLFHHGR
jgi:hypothetical protein